MNKTHIFKQKKKPQEKNLATYLPYFVRDCYRKQTIFLGLLTYPGNVFEIYDILGHDEGVVKYEPFTLAGAALTDLRTVRRGAHSEGATCIYMRVRRLTRTAVAIWLTRTEYRVYLWIITPGNSERDRENYIEKIHTT